MGRYTSVSGRPLPFDWNAHKRFGEKKISNKAALATVAGTVGVGGVISALQQRSAARNNAAEKASQMTSQLKSSSLSDKLHNIKSNIKSMGSEIGHSVSEKIKSNPNLVSHGLTAAGTAGVIGAGVAAHRYLKNKRNRI